MIFLLISSSLRKGRAKGYLLTWIFCESIFSIMSKERKDSDLKGKEGIKEIIHNFYNHPIALGELKEYVISSEAKDPKGYVLYGGAMSPDYGNVVVSPMGNGLLKFSVSSLDKSLGLIDLGTYEIEDVVDVLNEIGKTTPMKTRKYYDDSPNVCMR